jgi:dTDP-4-amino-4,6-dideoxygalactose transaminase
MEQGLVLPCHHGMGDADIDYVADCVDAYLASERGAPDRG